MKTPLEVLADALPVDPDDGTLPVEYISWENADRGSWSCTWGMPETVAKKQLEALQAAGYTITRPTDIVGTPNNPYVVPTPTGETYEG